MKIITWNVNSVRARLNNILDYIKQSQPDIMLLQETKTEDKNFPFDSFDFHFKEIILTGAFGKGNYFSEAVSCLSRLDFTDFKGKFYSLDNIVAGFKNSIDANDIKTFIKPHD